MCVCGCGGLCGDAKLVRGLQRSNIVDECAKDHDFANACDPKDAKPAQTRLPLWYLPSELPVNRCFDGIRTNMSRKGPFEWQTDSPRRLRLRPRKGTNLGAGNPSPPNPALMYIWNILRWSLWRFVALSPCS